ncbi:tetratricopeptide repeat protein [Microcystis aeruginosa CS-558/01A06]|uniref:Tetratricopeptide repeat protein n=1 Tax=Microcystis aeruginosa BLCC-F108 TaxID=2755317 RepID=A0A841UN57_MICAE|nr:MULTISPECIES: tetratricopeptide repeat protein [Microcystis]MBC1190089.1 tetratricopeptide repeat protein [Microcystis aeruginosa BLCC-F108]MCA2589209.1 tetratricopeptide repeat protein [Microcystis sp. M31BS1]MDB9409613.1 tetratricopeptide repeat protein [Microcystis aeruginosa CS-558/01A06]
MPQQSLITKTLTAQAITPPAQNSLNVKLFRKILLLSPLLFWELLGLEVSSVKAVENLQCPVISREEVDTNALKREIANYSATLRVYPSDPGTIKLYLQRGMAREKINDRNGALDDFSQYIWYSNYNAPAFKDRQLLAQAYYQRGKLKLAMAMEEEETPIAEEIPVIEEETPIVEKIPVIEEKKTIVEEIPVIEEETPLIESERPIRKQHQLKLLEAAQADFRQAFKYNPNESEVYFNLASVASLLDHQSLALDYYQRFIGYETENYRGYYHRGQLYSRWGNYAEAIKDYDLAILYKPDLIEGYYNRAIALEKIGGKREAFKDYKIVLKCSPKLFLAKNAPSSYQNRARVQLEIADEEVELANLSSNSPQGYQTAIEYYNGAIKDLALVIRINPNYDKIPHSRAFLKRGYAHLRLNNNQGAIQDYNQAIYLQPQDAKAYVYRGLMRANKYQEYAGALEDFTAAVARNRHDAAANYHRGLVLYKLGRYQEAVDNYNIALAQDDGINTPSFTSRSVCSENIRESADRNYFYNSRETDFRPNYNVSCHAQARGDAYFALKNFAAAERDYTTYIVAHPNDPEGYHKRANARFEKGDKQGAIEDYNVFLEKVRDARIFYSRGNSSADVGDNQGAITDYLQSLSINPIDVTAYSNRGNARTDTATIPDNVQVTPRISENPIAYNNRGIIRRQTGDKEGALEDLDKAVSLNSNNPIAYNNRGVIRFDLGDNAGALEDLNMAISLQSNYAEAYYNRGLVKEKIGDKKEAIADYQLAITYQPNYGEAYYNLALATYDDKNPSSRVASLNYLQKAANALIKTGNLELYERAVEWMLKMQ